MQVFLFLYLQHAHTHTREHTHPLTFPVYHFAVAMPGARFPRTGESFMLHTTCFVHTDIFSVRSFDTHSLFLSISPPHTHTSPSLIHHTALFFLPHLLSWQREASIRRLFHSEAVAHQRRSRSGRWSCRGVGGRRHEMGAMNSPDSTLRRDRGGLQMTNSQSGVVNSCFRLRHRCSRYRYSENRAAKSALPVIPVSTRLHQEVENRVAE